MDRKTLISSGLVAGGILGLGAYILVLRRRAMRSKKRPVPIAVPPPSLKEEVKCTPVKKSRLRREGSAFQEVVVTKEDVPEETPKETIDEPKEEEKKEKSSIFKWIDNHWKH